jgi:membrane protein implicated in regulation of membrane protease activity
MNVRRHAILVSAAALASALFVARVPARESAPTGHEHSVRASLEGAVMCVVEPVNQPPCGTPKSASR